MHAVKYLLPNWFGQVDQKHILFAVLNWGLGHATRSMPVIRNCLDAGHKVTIASDGFALDFLRQSFPDVRSIELPNYQVQYVSNNVTANAFHNARKVTTAINRERKVIKNWLQSHTCDAIISDNRYGCYDASVPCAIITHMMRLPGTRPIIDSIGSSLIARRLSAFDQVWIPDTPQRTLSGDLSVYSGQNSRFLGILSTMTLAALPREYRLTCVLSGPEPQRSIWEAELLEKLQHVSGRHTLVRGIAGNEASHQHGNTTVHQYLHRSELNSLINTSEIVICRSGYSSLMDLAVLSKRAVLVPTPGQPEQEYLAQRMSLRPGYFIQHQGDMDLAACVKEIGCVSESDRITTDPDMITAAIAGLINS